MGIHVAFNPIRELTTRQTYCIAHLVALLLVDLSGGRRPSRRRQHDQLGACNRNRELSKQQTHCTVPLPLPLVKLLRQPSNHPRVSRASHRISVLLKRHLAAALLISLAIQQRSEFRLVLELCCPLRVHRNPGFLEDLCRAGRNLSHFHRVRFRVSSSPELPSQMPICVLFSQQKSG